MSDLTRFSPLDISTHALREEGDSEDTPSTIVLGKFLPTPSARRATKATDAECKIFLISTHALREEGDMPYVVPPKLFDHFYPRPPRGGRRLEGGEAV